MSRSCAGCGPILPKSRAVTISQSARPKGPYAFSGKLITLAWAIELVVLPGGETERLDLLIGPAPVEVDLT
jgi:hypothetical protein